MKLMKIYISGFVLNRVAIRLGKSDVVDWLVKEIQENQIQLDIRVKKYVVVFKSMI